MKNETVGADRDLLAPKKFPEHRVSQDRGAPPKCPCPFATVCSETRQTVARMLDVAPLECLVYPFLLYDREHAT